MSEYFDAISFKKTKNDKTIAIRLGTAKRRDDGGFNLYLDAIPAPVNGQYEIQIVPQRERTAAAPVKRAELEDEIPF